MIPTGYIQVAVRLSGQGTDVPGRTFADTDRLVRRPRVAGDVEGRGGDEARGQTGNPALHLKQAKLFAVEFDSPGRSYPASRPSADHRRPRSVTLGTVAPASRRGHGAPQLGRDPAGAGPIRYASPGIQSAPDNLQIFGLNQISRDRGRDQP